MLKKGVNVWGLVEILTVFRSVCAAVASYRQIIHPSSKDGMGWKITCTDFKDVNHKTYKNWISPIRLGGG